LIAYDTHEAFVQGMLVEDWGHESTLGSFRN